MGWVLGGVISAIVRAVHAEYLSVHAETTSPF